MATRPFVPGSSDSFKLSIPKKPRHGFGLSARARKFGILIYFVGGTWAFWPSAFSILLLLPAIFFLAWAVRQDESQVIAVEMDCRRRMLSVKEWCRDDYFLDSWSESLRDVPFDEILDVSPLCKAWCRMAFGHHGFASDFAQKQSLSLSTWLATMRQWRFLIA